MEKFYLICGTAGKPVYQYNVTDYEKAVRTAKKAAVDNREDVFIMTSTQVVQAPVPEASVTALA